MYANENKQNAEFSSDGKHVYVPRANVYPHLHFTGEFVVCSKSAMALKGKKSGSNHIRLIDKGGTWYPDRIDRVGQDLPKNPYGDKMRVMLDFMRLKK